MDAPPNDRGGTALPGSPADFGKLIADETETRSLHAPRMRKLPRKLRLCSIQNESALAVRCVLPLSKRADHYRELALRCLRLADEQGSSAARDAFTNLATTWHRLAQELDEGFHETNHIKGNPRVPANQHFAATSRSFRLGRHMIRTTEAPD
jgi:hypothetical protein